MSWKPEVIADDSGKWAGNSLRFNTKEEAEAYVADLKARWFSVRDTRSIEVEEPATHSWVSGKLHDLLSSSPKSSSP